MTRRFVRRRPSALYRACQRAAPTLPRRASSRGRTQAIRRILLWSPNYAPDLVGIPPLGTDAAEGLAGRGHIVDVVTAVPNYPERVIHSRYRSALYWNSDVPENSQVVISQER